MSTFLTKIVTQKTLLAGAGLLAIAAAIFGFALISDPDPASAQSGTCIINIQQQPFTVNVNESDGPYVIDGSCSKATDYLSYGLWNKTDDVWLIGPNTQWLNQDGDSFSVTTDLTFNNTGEKEIEARVNWDASVGYINNYADRDVSTVDVLSGGGSGGNGGDPEPESCRLTSLGAVGVDANSETVSNSPNEGDADSDTQLINFTDYTDSNEYVRDVIFDTDVSYTYCAADTTCNATARATGALSSGGDTGETYIQGTGFPEADSDGETITLVNDTNEATGAEFQARTTTEIIPDGAGGPGIHSISSSASVSGVELLICNTSNTSDQAQLTVKTNPALSADMTRYAGPADIGGTTEYTRSYGSDINAAIVRGSVDGYKFDSWSGCDSTSSFGGPDVICEVNVNTGEEQTVTANYSVDNSGAPSCETVSVPRRTLSLNDSVYNTTYEYNSSEYDVDSYVVTYSDYTNSNQTVKTIFYDLTVEASAPYCDGTCSFDTKASSAGGSVHVPGTTLTGYVRDYFYSRTVSLSQSQSDSDSDFVFTLAPGYQISIDPLGVGDVSTMAAVQNIELEICDSGSVDPNLPPVAVDDGTVGGAQAENNPIPFEYQTLGSIDALDNDYDPDGATSNPHDDLDIISAHTLRSDTTVSIINNMLHYNPRDLAPGLEDDIDYTIRDNDGAVDSATAHIKIATTTGEVSVAVDVSGNVAPEDLERLFVTPLYGGGELGRSNMAGVAATYTVPLTIGGTTAAIQQGNIDLPTGYEFVDGDASNEWIDKDSNVDLTGQQNTEILGLPQMPNRAPTADFSYSFGSVGDLVYFTSQATDDTSVASHSWSFGDGGTSNSTNPSHQYAGDGTYDVELTVTDNDGATDTTTRSVTVTTVVSNSSPDARYNISTNWQSGSESSYTFSGQTSSDPDGDPLTYEWEYLGNSSGGGASATINSPNSAETDVRVTNPRSDQSVTFDFSLTVSDGSLSDTAPLSVTYTCQESGGGTMCLSDSGGGSGGSGGGTGPGFVE